MKNYMYYEQRGKTHKAKADDKWCLGDYIAICGKHADYVAHDTEDITCKQCLKVIAHNERKGD